MGTTGKALLFSFCSGLDKTEMCWEHKELPFVHCALCTSAQSKQTLASYNQRDQPTLPLHTLECPALLQSALFLVLLHPKQFGPAETTAFLCNPLDRSTNSAPTCSAAGHRVCCTGRSTGATTHAPSRLAALSAGPTSTAHRSAGRPFGLAHDGAGDPACAGAPVAPGAVPGAPTVSGALRRRLYGVPQAPAHRPRRALRRRPDHASAPTAPAPAPAPFPRPRPSRAGAPIFLFPLKQTLAADFVHLLSVSSSCRFLKSCTNFAKFSSVSFPEEFEKHASS